MSLFNLFARISDKSADNILIMRMHLLMMMMFLFMAKSFALTAKQLADT